MSIFWPCSGILGQRRVAGLRAQNPPFIHVKGKAACPFAPVREPLQAWVQGGPDSRAADSLRTRTRRTGIPVGTRAVHAQNIILQIVSATIGNQLVWHWSKQSASGSWAQLFSPAPAAAPGPARAGLTLTRATFISACHGSQPKMLI